jgi:hypothetical protein
MFVQSKRQERGLARDLRRIGWSYALATAIHAKHRGHDDVCLASLDKAVLRAHAELRSG